MVFSQPYNYIWKRRVCTIGEESMTKEEYTKMKQELES